jgi:2-keto-3-deoxy-L-rhamnonate aldolase RhmA
MSSDMREHLRSREQLIAAWLDLGSPASAELAAAAGFDAVIVDLEHGAGDEAAARGQIVAAGGPVLVRTPDGGAQAGRMLDFGGAGVIFPRVASAAEARELARAVRYAGARGVSPFARSNRWGAGGGAWREQADAGVACVIQIERATALEQVDAIAALEDVDALFMGPSDLSNDLGLPPDLSDPRLRAAAERIAGAAGLSEAALGRLAPVWPAVSQGRVVAETAHRPWPLPSEPWIVHELWRQAGHLVLQPRRGLGRRRRLAAADRLGVRAGRVDPRDVGHVRLPRERRIEGAQRVERRALRERGPYRAGQPDVRHPGGVLGMAVPADQPAVCGRAAGRCPVHERREPALADRRAPEEERLRAPRLQQPAPEAHAALAEVLQARPVERRDLRTRDVAARHRLRRRAEPLGRPQRRPAQRPRHPPVLERDPVQLRIRQRVADMQRPAGLVTVGLGERRRARNERERCE